jgi:hypothetical protein
MVLCIDEIRDGLCCAQVDLSGEKGTFGKLARCGKACACRNRGLER